MKPARELTAAQLRARIETLSVRSTAICDELIAAGRGRERGLEIRAQSDPLSMRWRECADALLQAADERSRRMAWSGTLKPIPQDGY